MVCPKLYPLDLSIRNREKRTIIVLQLTTDVDIAIGVDIERRVKEIIIGRL